MHLTAVLPALLTLLAMIHASEDHAFCSHRWVSSTFKPVSTNLFYPTTLPSDSGRSDLFVEEAGGVISLSRARQDGTFSNAATDLVPGGAFCGEANDEFVVADVNGDSRDDMVCLQRSDTSVYVRHWERRRYGVAVKVDGFTCDSANFEFFIGDFDGNGADDYMCVSSAATDLAGATIYLNTACKWEGTNHAQAYPFERPHHHHLICRPRQPVTLTIPDDGDKPACDISASDIVIISDMNGDGKDDITCSINTLGGITAYLSQITDTAVSFSAATSLANAGNFATECASSVLTPVDVDGDGDDDLACVSATQIAISYSTSAGYAVLAAPANCMSPGVATLPGEACRAGDFNGDGKEDLLCRYDNAGSNDFTEIIYAEKDQ